MNSANKGNPAILNRIDQCIFFKDNFFSNPDIQVILFYTISVSLV